MNFIGGTEVSWAQHKNLAGMRVSTMIGGYAGVENMDKGYGDEFVDLLYICAC